MQSHEYTLPPPHIVFLRIGKYVFLRELEGVSLTQVTYFLEEL